MTRVHKKIHGPGPVSKAILLAGFTAVLAGCATVPPPIQLMDQAQSEIRAARNAGAATSAPDTLAEAERRLAAAQQFSANGDNGKAADKAAEAEAAAATARAQAEAAKLADQIQQQTATNQNLEADLQQRQAAAAAAQQAASAPASATSSASPASSSAPVNLPPIQLGPPSTPAPESSSGAPASSTSSGNPDQGVYP